LVTGQKTHERKGQSLVNHLHGIWLDEYKRLSSVHYIRKQILIVTLMMIW
jgi:hypothetical protein